MKKVVVISIIILISASNFVFGEDKPWEKDFRGVLFGASEAMAKQKIPDLECSVSASLGRICTDINFHIGDVQTFNGMNFKDDKMVNVYLSFKSDDFYFFKDVFIKKYGNPTDTRKHTVRTKAGVEYNNEILTWNGNKVSLMLQKYSGKISTGSAVYATRDYLKGTVKEEDEKKKKAVTDF